jgi:uncharacterized protein (TIGR04145 family)
VFKFSAKQIDNHGNALDFKDHYLGPGTYKFALVDTNYPVGAEMDEDGGKMINTSHNNVNDWYMGEIYITINQDGTAESEFYLIAKNVAPRIKNASFSELKPMEAIDMKRIEAHFQDIGPQWIGCAGASTGPFVGILLCVAVVGVTLYSRKKKASAE